MKKRLIVFMVVFLLLGISSFISLIIFTYKPKIELLGEKEVVLLVGENYSEQLATINFLYDVDEYIEVNGEVDNMNVGEYTIKYTANIPYFKKKSSVTRKVKVIDAEAPLITLNGDDISIYVGDSYNEPGYKAIDSVDGDLTDAVEINNEVDVLVAGDYIITYNVKDLSGNTTSVTRKVKVKETTTTTTTTKKTASVKKDGDNSNPTTKKGSGQTLAILMYHYFYNPDAGEKGENANYMSTKDFEAQLKYLVDNNYYFPTWSEVADFIDGKKVLPKKSIVITIDDGHSSFFKYAIPIINKYNVKATAFIITSKESGTKYKKYLYDNINYESHTHAMHTWGCSGGHGGLFRCINYDKGLADLKQSIEILGSSDAIAYPYGDVTNNVLKITKAAGFKVGVTTVNKKAQVGMDRYQLPRVRMSKGVSLDSFIKSI